MRYLSLKITFLLLIGGFSCSDDTDLGTNPEINFLVYIMGEYVSGSWGPYGYTPFEENKFQFSGKIIADKVEIPEYIQFGDSVYDASDINYSMDPGSVSFKQIIEHVQNNVNEVKIKTSSGEISGEMVVPGIVTDISFSTNTITYKDEFTVSWQCQYAALYHLSYYIEESQFPGYSLYVDTTVTVPNIKILLGNRYYANKNFHIHIQPLNTPTLEAGSKGNMVGAGSGFISCYGITSSAEKLVQL